MSNLPLPLRVLFNLFGLFLIGVESFRPGDPRYALLVVALVLLGLLNADNLTNLLPGSKAPPSNGTGKPSNGNGKPNGNGAKP